MKKLLTIIIGLVLVFGLVACNNETKNESTDTTTEENTNTNTETSQKNKLDQIKESGQFVIGLNANYPPFEFHQIVDGQDEILGFDILFAEEIAKELGAELVIEDMEFSAVLTSIETGIVDAGISNITATEERAEIMDFSQQYFETKYVSLVNAQDAGLYNTPEKISEANVRVGVQTGTVQENIANEIEGATVVSLAKTPDLILQLKSGLVDVLILENVVADLYAVENEDLHSDTDAEFESAAGASVAVRKGEEELLEVINTVIDRLKEEGKIEEMYEQSLEQASGSN